MPDTFLTFGFFCRTKLLIAEGGQDFRWSVKVAIPSFNETQRVWMRGRRAMNEKARLPEGGGLSPSCHLLSSLRLLLALPWGGCWLEQVLPPPPAPLCLSL